MKTIKKYLQCYCKNIAELKPKRLAYKGGETSEVGSQKTDKGEKSYESMTDKELDEALRSETARIDVRKAMEKRAVNTAEEDAILAPIKAEKAKRETSKEKHRQIEKQQAKYRKLRAEREAEADAPGKAQAERAVDLLDRSGKPLDPKAEEKNLTSAVENKEVTVQYYESGSHVGATPPKQPPKLVEGGYDKDIPKEGQHSITWIKDKVHGAKLLLATYESNRNLFTEETQKLIKQNKGNLSTLVETYNNLNSSLSPALIPAAFYTQFEKGRVEIGETYNVILGFQRVVDFCGGQEKFEKNTPYIKITPGVKPQAQEERIARAAKSTSGAEDNANLNIFTSRDQDNLPRG